MKITLLAENLKNALAFVNHAVSNRSDLPILLHILLEVKNNTLTLSGTDLEIGIRVSLAVEVEEEGAVTVPAKTFSELISSLSQEKIILEAGDSSLTVVTKRTKSTFQIMSADDFPKLFEEKGEKIATLQSVDLRKDSNMVVFSASTDTTRPALSGILMKKEDGGFLFVATDGYRLSLKHHSVVSEELKIENTFIVPSRVFREIQTMKDEGEIAIYIAKNNNQVIFEKENMLIVGRLIEAQYPEFEKIIPTDHATKTTFEREELLKAVKICSIFAKESANIIKLSLKSDKIVVSSKTPSLGENTAEVEARLTGEENEIAFNARYLLDVLSHLENEILTLEMAGPLNPGVFKIEEDPSFLHLIMPIRVQQ